MNALDTPYFGIVLTMICFEFARYVQKKKKNLLLQPLLISILSIIILLLIFQIDVETYQKGGDIIQLFLGPITVVLAVPLYQQVHMLKKYKKAILIGIFFGTITGIISIVIVSVLLGMDKIMLASSMAKSVTTPIGIEVTKQLNGLPAVTILNILLTGIIGTIVAEVVCKIFKINHPIAKGIAIGTSSHALGTTKAFEMGEIEGAMSSLAIAIAGICTVFIVPSIWMCFHL